VTQLHYDEHGRASGLTDPRLNTTGLIKDDFGNLIRQRHPDTGEVRYAYDSAGNRIQKTDVQDTTTRYRYDAANRLIEETSPSGTTTLDYDPNSGRLAQLSDGNSHEGFAYDDQGRLIQHSRHIDGHRFITQYAYDGVGKLSQKRLPDGQVLSYHYYREETQRGQLRAITQDSLLGLKADTLVGEIDQDTSDGQTGLTFGNGLRVTRHHDKLGRTTAIGHSKQLRLQYQYDEQGRITGIDYNGILQNYDYDLFGRLTQAETNLGSYRYDYDSLGNRTYKEHADQDGNITTQENRYPNPGVGNRLLSQENGESQAYRYNASGSPKQIGERRYEYDAQQRPIRLYRVDPDDPENKTLVAEYAYNRFGERIKKVIYSLSRKPKVTYYLYDSHQLTAEADESGKVTAQYLYQQHRPIIKLEGKIAYAIHTDHLGAPRAVTDEKQQTVWSADYSPFGLIDIQTHQITLNLRLPGQYEDQESGTYYNYQRDYDPETGRYLTSDPIGLKGGLNTYAYVGGNPISTIDPFGQYWVTIDGVQHWIPDDGAQSPNMTSIAVAVPNPVCPQPAPTTPTAPLPTTIPDWTRYQPANDPSPSGGSSWWRIGRGWIGLVAPLLMSGNDPVVRWSEGDLIFDYLTNSQRLVVYDTHGRDIALLWDHIATYDVVIDRGNTWLRSQDTGRVIAGIDPDDGDVLSTEQMERMLRRQYDDYTANGGELSYEDWLAEGMPDAQNSSSDDRFWIPNEVDERRVYQRSDIDPDLQGPDSRTNLERMRNGQPPYMIGSDGTLVTVELHHMIQTERLSDDGQAPLAEVPADFHDRYYNQIHIYPRNDPEYQSWRRNNPDDARRYDNYRRRYWRTRAHDFE
ncbi:MAG: RHS repeat-associated core domain-containing protein, partial [Candidatus Thiodiazotropha endolucinida]